MTQRITQLRTLWALGPRSLARVGAYRLLLRSKRHPVQRLASEEAVGGPLFAFNLVPPAPPGLTANTDFDGTMLRFDWHREAVDGAAPDWFNNPFGDAEVSADRPWWTIPDFAVGDIKGVWEASRFGWAVALATQVRCGSRTAPAQLNRWLADWARHNPPFLGPNWKCGQEASLRVMHLLAAAVMLGEAERPTPALTTFVRQHLARIAPTLAYAVGQDNNHGTSEAIALYVGGDFLAQAGVREGAEWHRIGRRQLEERAQALIARDGSFSQYSVNYHRLMLDSYSFAESWRRRRQLSDWSSETRIRLRSAAAWLRGLIDPRGGDGPAMGASDGARILPFTGSGYRDYRPSVGWASALFEGYHSFADGSGDAAMRWLGLDLPTSPAPPRTSVSHDDGGWHVLHAGEAMAVMRYPRFRFRPGQADLLHVDLWHRGRPLLCDAGTYSYNDPAVPGGDLASIADHNSICFDESEPMPRLGRFLFGDWVRARGVERCVGQAPVHAAAGYRDARGRSHHRTVELWPDRLRVIDRIGGRFKDAILRWRLAGGAAPPLVEIDGAPIEPTIARRPGARHYHRLEHDLVAEWRIDRPATIVSTLTL